MPRSVVPDSRVAWHKVASSIDRLLVALVADGEARPTPALPPAAEAAAAAAPAAVAAAAAKVPRPLSRKSSYREQILQRADFTVSRSYSAHCSRWFERQYEPFRLSIRSFFTTC